jgi:ubiquinone/menaquinone biosynthesis C-methylase UbiE
MRVPILKSKNLDGFNNPTALPKVDEEARRWQEENRIWWESHPMRYDWREKVGVQEFTRDFYIEVDRRFFSGAEQYMPRKKIPFDLLINFDSLTNKRVLEVGIGCGSHAGLLAQYSRSFIGMDITDYAVKCTSERMKCFGLDATIIQMDAERMGFNDNSFDFVWTWGVIHHSANIRLLLSEIKRVLRPNGRAIIMVYHRNFWNWYVINGLFRGLLRGELLRTKSLHKVVQRWADGAIARYYSISEWRNLVSEFFHIENIQIFGDKSEIVPLPGGKAKAIVMSLIPNNLSRFITNRCKMGGFLVSTLSKKI